MSRRYVVEHDFRLRIEVSAGGVLQARTDAAQWLNWWTQVGLVAILAQSGEYSVEELEAIDEQQFPDSIVGYLLSELPEGSEFGLVSTVRAGRIGFPPGLHEETLQGRSFAVRHSIGDAVQAFSARSPIARNRRNPT